MNKQSTTTIVQEIYPTERLEMQYTFNKCQTQGNGSLEIIERVSARSYRVKTIKGGISIRNRKFIRIKHTDSRQSLQTTEENRTLNYSNTHTGRPKRITRRPQRLIESMNFIRTWDAQRRFA